MQVFWPTRLRSEKNPSIPNSMSFQWVGFGLRMHICLSNLTPIQNSDSEKVFIYLPWFQKWIGNLEHEKGQRMTFSLPQYHMQLPARGYWRYTAQWINTVYPENNNDDNSNIGIKKTVACPDVKTFVVTMTKGYILKFILYNHWRYEGKNFQPWKNRLLIRSSSSMYEWEDILAMVSV